MNLELRRQILLRREAHGFATQGDDYELTSKAFMAGAEAMEIELGWKPIATIPYDGARRLVLINGSPFICRQTLKGGWQFVGGKTPRSTPTHWMDIPKVPK